MSQEHIEVLETVETVETALEAEASLLGCTVATLGDINVKTRICEGVTDTQSIRVSKMSILAHQAYKDAQAIVKGKALDIVESVEAQDTIKAIEGDMFLESREHARQAFKKPAKALSDMSADEKCEHYAKMSAKTKVAMRYRS